MTTQTPRPTDAQIAELLRDGALSAAQIGSGMLAADMLDAADALEGARDCYHGGCECIELRAKLDALAASPVGPTPEQVERLARHLESTSVRIHWGEDADARNRAEYDRRALAALRAAITGEG